MSNVTYTSVGKAGDTITVAPLNNAFTTFSTTLNQDNLKVDSVHNYQLSMAGIQLQKGNAANQDPTTQVYTGNTYQAITHGTEALEVGPANLVDGSVIRVHWHQYVESMFQAAPSLDDFTSFALEWDIGAGYTSIPTNILWAVSSLCEDGVAQFDQSDTHNMSGSWVFRNNTGSTITITGIRLTVRPNNLSALNTCTLGWGNLCYLIQNR